MLELNPDDLLCTTRTVRKRLDFDRPVPRSEIERCVEVALQAPNGSNMQQWHWLLVDDPDTIAILADLYRRSMEDYLEALGDAVGENYAGARVPRSEKITESVLYLRDNFHRVPAVVLPLLANRPEGKKLFYQASLWGSILPAAWSFMLAGRARGIASAWTTVHLWREREVAQLLDIPDHYSQTVMLPVAYSIGTDFKPAYRQPVQEVSSWNGFRVG